MGGVLHAARYTRRVTCRKYQFDRFRLDPAIRELYKDSDRIILPGSAFDCLVYLVEHSDRAVGRDELISAVWGRTDVSDTQLSQAVGRVRGALGDTGGAQTTIRTIPRFGYRWVAETRCNIADDSSAGALIDSPQAEPSAPGEASPLDRTVDPLPTQRGNEQPQRAARRESTRGAWLATLVVACIVAIGLLAYAVKRPSESTAPHADPHGPSLTERSAAVLPAEVDAPAEWRWLRLGLTSLIADRLRDGNLATMPSEVVIHLLQQRQVASAAETGDQAALQPVASLRIQPQVTFANNRWRVRLQVIADEGTQMIEVTSANPLAAARSAADQLLVRLGHRPPAATDDEVALDELLGRIRAASLAGQLRLADTLIREAPVELRAQPEVQLITATNVYRAGDYKGARRIASALLDTPSMRGKPVLHGQALNILGIVAVRQEELETAAKCYADAVELLRDEPDRAALGTAYMGQGVIAAKQFRYDEAIAQLGRARIELAAAGDLLGVAQIDENLGNMQALRYKPHIAVEMLDAAQKRFSQLGAQEQRALTLTNLVQVQMQLLEHERALATTELFWPPEAHTSNQRLHWRLIWTRAAALVDNGKLAEARPLLDRIAADADPELDAEVRVTATALAAQLALLTGNRVEAARLSDAARTPLLNERDPIEYLRTSLVRAQALRETGNLQQAAAEIGALELTSGTTRDPRRALYVELALAQQAFAVRDSDGAMLHFAAALKGAQALSIPEDLVAVSRPYVEALLADGRISDAEALAGGVARWADQDFAAAWTQACLLRRLGSDHAAHDATATAMWLAGERALPTPMCGDMAMAAGDRNGAIPAQ